MYSCISWCTGTKFEQQFVFIYMPETKKKSIDFLFFYFDLKITPKNKKKIFSKTIENFKKIAGIKKF